MSEWEQMSLFTDEELGVPKGLTGYHGPFTDEHRKNFIPGGIIGLIGYAQSGKDTTANILIKEYGYSRLAFADKVKDLLYAVNPMVACSPSGYLKDLVDLVGWDEAKQEPQVRRLLQDLGLGGRDVFGKNVWVNELERSIIQTNNHNLVITDVRFKNEADKIKQLGGRLWRIKRVDTSAANSHVSEVELDGYPVDQIIKNDGSLEDLEILIKKRMMFDAFPE
jgi:hypothetical protein